MMSTLLDIQKVRKDGNIEEKLLYHSIQNYVELKSKIYQHRRSEPETEKSDLNWHDVTGSSNRIHHLSQARRTEGSSIYRDHRTGSIFRDGTCSPPSWPSNEGAILLSHAKYHPPHEYHPPLDRI